MSIIEKIYSISPFFELFARKIYYDFLRSSLGKNKHTGAKHYNTSKNISVSHEGLINHLKQLGIKKGDLLVVHSSSDGLKDLDCRENELLEALIDLVGNEGTIAMPAFPDEAKLKTQEGKLVYDSVRSLAWTGMLPNLLLRKKGAKRSEYPYNPLVAYGPLADEMMSNNINAELAHGKGSCWGFCVEKHAKILFLGLPAYHSCTVLHVVEDYQPSFWPKDWYDEKVYISKINDDYHMVKTKIRNNKWSKYLAERYTENKYIKSGLILSDSYMDIPIRYISDSNNFVNTILKDWKKYKFFYLPSKCLFQENRIYHL